MRRRIIATVIAAAIAATSLPAAPARADNDDVAKIVAGLATLYILNEVLRERERDRDRDRNRQVSRGSIYDPIVRPRYRTLPDRCFRRAETRDGTRRYFPRRCLRRAGVNVDQLPDRCAYRIRTDRGKRTVYGARCLRERGYRLEARVR